jgi:hypothetical protein
VKHCAQRSVADTQHDDFFALGVSAEWRVVRYFFVGSVSKA